MGSSWLVKAASISRQSSALSTRSARGITSVSDKDIEKALDDGEDESVADSVTRAGTPHPESTESPPTGATPPTDDATPPEVTAEPVPATETPVS